MSENPGPCLLINRDQIEIIKDLSPAQIFDPAGLGLSELQVQDLHPVITLYFFNIRANKQETPQQVAPDGLCVTAQTPVSSYIKIYIKLLLLRIIVTVHYVILPYGLSTSECCLK